jgi:hypothetical protein
MSIKHNARQLPEFNNKAGDSYNALKPYIPIFESKYE